MKPDESTVLNEALSIESDGTLLHSDVIGVSQPVYGISNLSAPTNYMETGYKAEHALLLLLPCLVVESLLIYSQGKSSSL